MIAIALAGAAGIGARFGWQEYERRISAADESDVALPFSVEPPDSSYVELRVVVSATPTGGTTTGSATADARYDIDTGDLSADASWSTGDGGDVVMTAAIERFAGAVSVADPSVSDWTSNADETVEALLWFIDQYVGPEALGDIVPMSPSHTVVVDSSEETLRLGSFGSTGRASDGAPPDVGGDGVDGVLDVEPATVETLDVSPDSALVTSAVVPPAVDPASVVDVAVTRYRIAVDERSLAVDDPFEFSDWASSAFWGAEVEVWIDDAGFVRRMRIETPDADGDQATVDVTWLSLSGAPRPVLRAGGS